MNIRGPTTSYSKCISFRFSLDPELNVLTSMEECVCWMCVCVGCCLVQEVPRGGCLCSLYSFFSAFVCCLPVSCCAYSIIWLCVFNMNFEGVWDLGLFLFRSSGFALFALETLNEIWQPWRRRGFLVPCTNLSGELITLIDHSDLFKRTYSW